MALLSCTSASTRGASTAVSGIGLISSSTPLGDVSSNIISVSIQIGWTWEISAHLLNC